MAKGVPDYNFRKRRFARLNKQSGASVKTGTGLHELFTFDGSAEIVQLQLRSGYSTGQADKYDKFKVTVDGVEFTSYTLDDLSQRGTVTGVELFRLAYYEPDEEVELFFGAGLAFYESLKVEAYKYVAAACEISYNYIFGEY
jgi:hypothetical protein